MSNTGSTTPTDGPAPPDPSQQERCRPVPPHIADLLAILHILLAYGRHIALTLERRSTAWGFSAIAQCFGTASVPAILARVARGIMRIQALQRVLLDRARRGRDLVWLTRRQRAPRKPPVPSAASVPPATRPRPRHTADEIPDPDNLPTLKQLEAEIRRQSIGNTIGDICRDLGIAPRLCSGRFWDALYMVLSGYRGNFTRYYLDIRRRETEFEPCIDATAPLEAPQQSRGGLQRMVGFFIGEQWPVLPFPVPLPRRLLRDAAATGPP